MFPKKNIKLGKIKILLLLSMVIFILNKDSFAEQAKNEKLVELKILDKVSSKNSTILLKIGQEKKINNLMIKVLKCQNSKFDDNPEITAYMQVKDLNIKQKDKVFIFNDWTFASSPSLKPFDHPVYDIWLNKCID
tara:strand:+ start:119 stop:523 length:405 start_codon:yes stop_codon:yes gene_type:complete